VPFSLLPDVGGTPFPSSLFYNGAHLPFPDRIFPFMGRNEYLPSSQVNRLSPRFTGESPPLSGRFFSFIFKKVSTSFFTPADKE